MNLVGKIRRPSIAIAIDAFIVINSYLFASLILFANGALHNHGRLTAFLGVAAITHCALNYRFGLYRYVGRYVGFVQALNTLKASVAGIIVLLLAVFLFMPSSALNAAMMIPFGGMLVMLICGGVRFYPRIFYERSFKDIESHANIMVIGAGSAGERIVRNIQNDRNSNMRVIAVVDDSPSFKGKELHGIPVYTPLERIKRIAENKGVDEILIAIPSADTEQFRRIWRICKETDLPVKTLGSLQNTHSGEVDIRKVRGVRIEDLLGRQPVQTNYHQIAEFLKDKVVVVTGAGGSIGSELVIQISKHSPRSIVLIDQDETALYDIYEKLASRFFLDFELYIADVRTKDKIDQIFSKASPDIVFHAAAYKHVPLVEIHPDEGVLNNVLGTLNVASLSGEYEVDTFVNISTDKAVDPVNVMGATKRLGERIVSELGEYYPQTTYCSVRFGNVLGSRGSVIPIFRKQILEGGPVTVTDPRMTRYFMMIGEAVDLVLQAAAFRDNNSIYVLDMGEPVKIVELAEQMISFLKPPKKVDLVYTGLRPGEKLHESLYEVGEEAAVSAHRKIYSIDRSNTFETNILDHLYQLFEASRSNDHEAIRGILQSWIPSYQPFRLAESETSVAGDTQQEYEDAEAGSVVFAEPELSSQTGKTGGLCDGIATAFAYNWKWSTGAPVKLEDMPVIKEGHSGPVRRRRPAAREADQGQSSYTAS